MVIYVTANTKNIESMQCMMHAGTLIQEFDRVYTQKGHGRQLRENNTKLTSKDENADLNVHERVVFCHVLDMRENLEKKRINLEGESKLSSNYDSRLSNSSEK